MLVIIDCQTKFPASKQVVDPIVKEIKRAKKQQEWIMVVEYRGEGRTLKAITSKIKRYYKVVKVVKEQDDGSSVIFDRIFGYRWSVENNLNTKHVGRIRHLRVCGVNTSACVRVTVYGLRRFIKTTVIAKACANGYSCTGVTPEQMHQVSLEIMKKWKNVTVR
jgi:nicotinamidase-related amidase